MFPLRTRTYRTIGVTLSKSKAWVLAIKVTSTWPEIKHLELEYLLLRIMILYFRPQPGYEEYELCKGSSKHFTILMLSKFLHSGARFFRKTFRTTLWRKLMQFLQYPTSGPGPCLLAKQRPALARRRGLLSTLQNVLSRHLLRQFSCIRTCCPCTSKSPPPRCNCKPRDGGEINTS